jgi:hypothetical protein
MLDQVAGALLWAGVVLAYLLLVEAMAAAVVLLARFTVLQWRSLRTLLSQEPPRRAGPMVVDQDQAEAETFRVGGGLMRWD